MSWTFGENTKIGLRVWSVIAAWAFLLWLGMRYQNIMNRIDQNALDIQENTILVDNIRVVVKDTIDTSLWSFKNELILDLDTRYAKKND